jgi:predicted permease
MRSLRALWKRMLGIFRGQDSEFAAELEGHLTMHVEDGMRAGLSAEEARRQALIRLGGMEQTKQAYRERGGLPAIETLWRDVAYGFRTLRKNPGFALVSILVIAIGIGANVALFTVVRSVLLRPLPFPESDRLVALWGQDDPVKNSSPNIVAAGDFYDWQKASHGFEQMAIWRWSGFNLSGNADELPEFVNAGSASWNFFPMLGVQPVLGRSFTPGDDKMGANPTVLLTWSFFKRRFNADPSIVGKTVKLYAQPFTVIGVLPEWFRYPDPKIQLWVTFVPNNPSSLITSHYSHGSNVLARLKPGVTMEQAAAEINAVQHQLFLQLSSAGPVVQGITARPMLEDVVQDIKTPLYVLMAAVGCLLLIACLNLSNLLVARGAARRKEIAVRMALGARRLRLCREQITESLLICITGGALGMLLAVWATRWITVRWVHMPRADAVHPDWVVTAFALGITFAIGIFSGLAPALSATGSGVLQALQDGARSIGGSASKASLRKVLLTAEIALTVILLVCSGLLFKSFLRLRSVDLGCATKNVLTMQYFLHSQKYAKPAQAVAFDTQLLERVRNMPGVDAAGLTNVVPGGGYYGDTEVTFPEHPPLPPEEHRFAARRVADPGYFAAMQIPLVAGRSFAEEERFNRDKYVVVDQEFVRRYFPNEDPIGKHVAARWDSSDPDKYEIVGVVRDTPYALNREKRPMIWFPILSGLPPAVDSSVLVVRSHQDVTTLALPIQKIIAQLDADMPVSKILTMEEIIGNATADASFTAILVLGFAGLSLLLAAVGLYGVLAYLVTQRTSEIGIRMALGAQREQVMGLVLLDGLKPALIGLGLGLAGSVAATQMIRSVLYATRPLDVVVYVSTVAVLLLAASMACLIPAWRAARVDPMQALRAE